MRASAEFDVFNIKLQYWRGSSTEDRGGASRYVSSSSCWGARSRFEMDANRDCDDGCINE